MRANRALCVALGFLALAIAAIHLRQNGVEASPLPPCLFHRATGLHCAGCGMTRASHAALHGRIIEALDHNLLGMILMPVAGIGIALELLAWMRGKPGGPRLCPGRTGLWLLLGSIIAFWILRNIPLWPFTYLAPGT